MSKEVCLNTSQRVNSELNALKKEIPERIFKQLTDKHYDKRKQGGSDLRNFLRNILEEKPLLSLSLVLDLFKEEYINNESENYRKGGLMAFSALAFCFSETVSDMILIDALLDPVLVCTHDFDSKIRFYALETIYNITKVYRQTILFRINSLFGVVSRLMTDSDQEVRRAADSLNNLLQMVVVECEADDKYLNAENFIKMMNEKIVLESHPNVQMLLISWLTVLMTIPRFSFLHHLPIFVEGLICMHRSDKSEVQQAIYRLTKDILTEVKESGSDFGALLDSMVNICFHKNTKVRVQALTWICELTKAAGNLLITRIPDAMKTVLGCLSDEKPAISFAATEANLAILDSLSFSCEANLLNFPELIEVLLLNLDNPSLSSKIAVLEWLVLIQQIDPNSLEPYLISLLSHLCELLADNVHTLSGYVLLLLSNLSNEYFDLVMTAITKLLRNTKHSKEVDRTQIITTFCLKLGLEKVFKSFSEFLATEEDREFSQGFIDILCNMLLNSEDFEEERERLKYCLENEDQEYIEFFQSLFKAWCVNPGATLTLTLLVQAYELGYDILKILSKCKIDVQLLKQLAWLVHLLDSPIFVHLRLQMLENKHPLLLRSLYAILVFLPLSEVHLSLQLRLKGAFALLKACSETESHEETASSFLFDYDALVQAFLEKNVPIDDNISD